MVVNKNSYQPENPGQVITSLLTLPRFRASEFTINFDATRQVDDQQLCFAELFFVLRNQNPPRLGEHVAV
jgi:hypothetical protein